MKKGMTLTIEPIVVMYPYTNPNNLFIWEDNWSIVSPKNPSAQWEHTIYINDHGYEILTLRENEDIIIF